MAGRNPDELRATFRSVGDRLRATPGVEASSLSWASLPLEGDDEELFWLESEPKPTSAGDMKWALKYVVEPGYLSAMRTPLLRGRFFQESDNEHAPLVAVVDEVLANTYFPNQDPIGRILHLSNFDQPAQVVGVVKHVKQWGLDLDDQYELRAQLYLACMQLPDNAMRMGAYGTGLLVRSGSDMDPQLKSLRESIQQINRDFVVFGAQTMDSIVSDSLAERRFSMILFSAFSLLALLLAAVGIYGVVSYLVGQRTHEIGVRMALGARRSHVLTLVLGQGARMSAIGMAIGLVAALGLSRFLIGMLYGVGAMDPLTYAAVLLLLGLIALLACYLPARRATRVDPMVALRYE
jgi:predicted permease